MPFMSEFRRLRQAGLCEFKACWVHRIPDPVSKQNKGKKATTQLKTQQCINNAVLMLCMLHTGNSNVLFLAVERNG